MFEVLRGLAGKLARRALAIVLAANVIAASAVAQEVIPPKAFVLTPGGINVSDGSIVYSQTDLALGTLSLERFHRSGNKQPNNPMFGTNFSSNFDIYVARRTPSTGDRTVIVHIGNSASGIYWQGRTNLLSIGPQNMDAEKGMLSWNGTQYIYLDSSGTTYTFSGSVTASVNAPFTVGWKIAQIDFADGRRQTFSYDGSGNLKLVEDSTGYAMVFDYSGGDVTAACAFKRSETYVTSISSCTGALLKTSYGYTSGMLTSAVDPLNQTTTYTNASTGVTCIIPPGYSACTVTQVNGGPRLVANPNMSASQVLADGGTWSVWAYDNAGPTRMEAYESIPYSGHLEAEITDPNGNVTGMNFTLSSPTSMVDPNGRITYFHYLGGDFDLSKDYGSFLVEATYPEGDKYQAEYLGPFRAVTHERHVPKGGGTPLERLYSYQSCEVAPGTYQNCAKPISIRDPAGRWTNYTYASHGGVLTEMAPAPVTNGARPLKVTTWTQRYPWVKNSAGTLVQGTLAVWVKNTETACQTLAGAAPLPVCDSSAPQTVTSYEYGAAGTGQSLLVRAVVVTADGTSLRTCYGYDPFDRKIYESSPNANLTSTQCGSVAP